MPHNLMILPSLACPASCRYCFGPHSSGHPMSREMVEAVVHWLNAIQGRDEPLEITFHGGEPLVPGAAFFRMALPLLREGLAPVPVRFAVQSNLWLLTDELCDLFSEYCVSIGTSLDGPETINDRQRGKGYFARTMSGIRLARAHGLDVGCICTFTSTSAPHADGIFDFFARENLPFSIHAALPAPVHANNGWTLAPDAHAQLLEQTLERYLVNMDKVRIPTLDAMCRSISTGRGETCTFGDCLGKYLAVDPQGWIYPCQRLAGLEAYRLGNVQDCPTLDALETAPAWRLFQDRQERIEEECGDCPHLEYCRGGCPYNALDASNVRFSRTLRDPHCPAYRRTFSHITKRWLNEVFSEQNMAAVVKEGTSKHSLMQMGGRLTQIMRGGPHPSSEAHRPRELAAAVALAACESPAEALQKLNRAGLVTHPERALDSLTKMRSQLDSQSRQGLFNAYIHVTLDCNLSCSHCYAEAGADASPPMAVDDIVRMIKSAAEAGFRKAVITGGEPLVHPQREALLDALAAIRAQVKSLQIVLRTNLACSLTPDLIARLALSTDRIVVSVDGSEASHNARRGAGAYARGVANLRALLAAHPTTRLSLSAALTAGQTTGSDGEAVRALGKELGVPVRFNPLLPLGRGAELDLRPASETSLDDGAATAACHRRPAATCGLGMSLYVGPDGECYPCYALMQKRHRLGNALTAGLADVLARNDAYRLVTVDNNIKCRACAVRYICGGFCRAWSSDDDPNAPPLDCTALHARALNLLGRALEVLGVSPERWTAAELPLPYAPVSAI